MDVNGLGLIVTAMFVLIPSVFLILLYAQTASRESSGGPR